jgi:predicted Zn-dependent protease
LEGPTPDPPRALAIIQPLIEQFPEHPYFRDTRGQILLKMGRYKEATQDLEFALPKLDPRAKQHTHRSLAEAYRKLGFADLAAEHEKLAAKTEPEGKEAGK